MTVTVANLRDEVNAKETEKTTAALTRCLAEAVIYVGAYLLDNLATPEAVAEVPTEIVDKAILVTAVDLYSQSKAPNGVINEQYDVGDGSVGSTPIRVSRDPIRGARAVLELWIGPVVA